MSENTIHPTAIVEPGVVLGRGNVVGPYSVLEAPLVIGDGNWIGSHCCIGGPAEWTGVTGPEIAGRHRNGIVIGDRNVLREHTTINQGTDALTTIGDGSYLMAYAHVAHDSTIGDGATLTNGVQLAGHTHVGSRANLGLGTVVHQGVVIGPYAMIGMQSTVTRHVAPAIVAFGSPARARRVNLLGLERAGFAAAAIDDAVAAFLAGRRPSSDAFDVAYGWYDERVAAEAD